MGHLANLRGKNIEEEFHYGLGAVAKKDLEVFNHEVSRRVAFDADGEHILLDLGHRLLALQLLILLAKHDLAVLLKLRVLLQELVNIHDLLGWRLQGIKYY